MISKVSLNSTTDATTIPSPATGLLIYNTAIAGTDPNNVTPSLMINNGTPSSPLWTKIIAQNTVSGTGVIGVWSGSNSGNSYTGTITSVADGVNFRSSLKGNAINGYIDYVSVSSGTATFSTSASEEGNNGWYWKGQDATNVNTTFTAVTKWSEYTMGSGRRTSIIVNVTKGYVYRATLTIDNTSNQAFYMIEKVK